LVHLGFFALFEDGGGSDHVVGGGLAAGGFQSDAHRQMLTPGGMPDGNGVVGQRPGADWLLDDGPGALRAWRRWLRGHPGLSSPYRNRLRGRETTPETAASKIRLTECQVPGCQIQWGVASVGSASFRAQSRRRTVKARSVISSISPVHSFCSSSTKSRRILRAEFASAWVMGIFPSGPSVTGCTCGAAAVRSQAQERGP
jgi:hypothetical protein